MPGTIPTPQFSRWLAGSRLRRMPLWMLLTSAQNTFEGGTNTTTISTGNSGAASGHAFQVVTVGAGSTLTYSNTQEMRGALSASFTLAASTITALEYNTTIGTTTTHWVRFYLYAAANPAVTTQVYRATNAGTTAATISVNSSGKLILAPSTGTTAFTSTNSITLNAWNRIELQVVSSATVGSLQVQLYARDSTTVVEDSGVVDTLNTLAAATTYCFGQSVAVAGTTWAFFLDDVGVDSTGWLGPSLPLPVTLNNTAEANIADETTVSIINSGAEAVDHFDTVLIDATAAAVFDNAQSARGLKSYRISTGGTTGQCYLGWSPIRIGTWSRVWTRQYIRFGTIGTAHGIQRLRGAGGQVLRVSIDTTGHLTIRNAADTVVATSTAVLAAATWYRIEVDTAIGASATSVLRLYTDIHSTTIAETLTASAQNFGTTLIDEVHYGVVVTTANVPAFWMGDLAFSSVDWIGPSPFTTPTPFSVVQDWVFATTGSASNPTSVSVALGAQATAGNTLLVAATSDSTVVTPDGYTLLASSVHNAGSYLYGKIADGTEVDARISPTAALGASACIGVAEVTGMLMPTIADQLDQTVSNGSASGATTRSTGTTGTTGRPDEYAVALWGYSASQGIYANGGSNKWSGQTNSFVEKGDVGTTKASGTNVGLCIATKLLTATGTVESTASTSPDAPPSESLLVTLRVNPAAGGELSDTILQVTETNTALAVSRTKSKVVGQSTQTGTALPLGRTKSLAIGLVATASTGQPVSELKSKTIGQVTNTNVARWVVGALRQAAQTNVALPVQATRSATIGQVADPSTALALGQTFKSKAIGQASSANAGQSVTRTKSRVIGQPGSSASALPVTGLKTRTVGLVVQTNTGLAVARQKLMAVGLASSAALAQTVARLKTRTIGQAVNPNAALSVTELKTRAIAQVTSGATVFAVARRKTLELGQVTSINAAAGLVVTIKTIGQVVSIDSALTIGRRKVQVLGQPGDSASASTLGTGAKAKPIDMVQTTDTVGALGILRSRVIGLVEQITSALGLAGHKIKTIGRAGDIASVLPISSPSQVPPPIPPPALASHAAPSAVSWAAGLDPIVVVRTSIRAHVDEPESISVVGQRVFKATS